MKVSITLFALMGFLTVSNGAGAPFAPYYDTFLDGRTNLTDIYDATEQASFHLAFIMGTKCVPLWGARYPIDEPNLLSQIKLLQSKGGELIVASGGALSPYLENSCKTAAELAAAYKYVLDTVGTNHLDIDVESTVDFDIMNPALSLLQAQRPSTTVTFTLMVQSDDYGLTPSLGVKLLEHAKKSGVRVDIVNAMVMEFYSQGSDWGEAVINASEMVLQQLKVIWPEKSDSEIKKMYGATPLIGQNNNGRKFLQTHATKLVDWANENHIGMLGFWSIERDNGGCPDGRLLPTCSGIPQTKYEFTKIFQQFTG